MKTLFTSITARHDAVFNRPWLKSSSDYRYAIGALLLILLAAMINFDMRDRQWTIWQDNKQVFFADETPLVTTTDAAYFLIQAEDLINGENLNSFSESRLYPENTASYQREHHPDQVMEQDRPLTMRDIPLLSAMIAWMAETFFENNVTLAGHTLIAISAFITVVTIGGMFWAAGYPVEGALAGLGLGMSTTYLVRTGVGRIDTDQLIVAFLALALGLVLMAARERNLARMLGYTLLTALVAEMTLWWHENALYIVLIPFLFFFSILIQQHNIKRAFLAAGVFILATNPLAFLTNFKNLFVAFLTRFFGIDLGEETLQPEMVLIFPDTFKTITELSRLDLLATLNTMTGHPVIGVIGLVGFLFWVIVRPSRGIVFLPFVMLGVMAVLGGVRYAFFAAPFVWFGVAWLIMTAGRLILSYHRFQQAMPALTRDFISLGIGAVMVIGTAAWLNDDYLPGPTFSKEVTKTFRTVGEIAGAEKGIIATWWDYGYYAHFHSGGLATIHDGGAQVTPRTHLFARGLVSSNTDELIQITKFIAAKGHAGITANGSSLLALNQAIARAPMPEKPVYLVVTEQMTGWAGSIGTLGRFDVETGRYLPGQTIRQHYGVIVMNCKSSGKNKLDCNRGIVDLDHGTLNGQPAFGEVVLTENGVFKGRRQKENNSPLLFLISKYSNGRVQFRVVHKELWNSSLFNLLEKREFNENRLALVVDHYPAARVYRVLR